MEDLQRRRASRPRKGLRRAAVLLASCLAAAALPTGAPSSARAAVPEPGSAGIGDSYFPLDGNGGIDVARYRIHDRYAFAKRRLSGWTLLNVRATQDLSRFHLDFLLPVQRVTVDGRRADFRRIGHELRIFPAVPLLTGQRFRVRVDYAGNPSRAAYDLERNWLASATEVVTMNEPHMAPWWFPANDHPRDRARMDIYINVPRGAQVVANGHRISRTVNGGRATTHWQARETMAPYLAFFAAGSFTVRQGRRDDGLPWYVAVSDALPTAVRARSMRLMLRTPGVLSWLETQLGDYPFSTTGGLTTALNPGFALENQTRPTYPVMGAGALSIVVHELAHQWFGDSVAVENWRDIWLNEGAATFMEVQYAATHGGPSASDWLDNRYRLHGADDDLWNLSIGDPGPRRLFDEAVYQRGAMTFQALRQRIGEPAFWQLLHRWLDENRYGNGSTPEFHALAEEVSGQDLDGFFQAWLFERSRPAATAENGLRPAEATLSRAGAPTGR